jgi:hypothetical protein
VCARCLHVRSCSKRGRCPSYPPSLPRRRIVDLGAGHGLLAQILLLLDDSSPCALAVDKSGAGVECEAARALVLQWPRIAGRVTFAAGPLEDVVILPDDIVVSCHACGSLTDLVLERGAPHACAVLPCCHDLAAGDARDLAGWVDGPLAIDIMRAVRLRQQRLPCLDAVHSGRHHAEESSVACLSRRARGGSIDGMPLILHGLTPIHWALAGAGIAGVTLTLLFVANRRLGISTSFEDLCSFALTTPYFRRPAVISGRPWRLPFAAGLVLGGFLSAVLAGGWSPVWALGMFDRIIGFGPAGKLAWMFTAGCSSVSARAWRAAARAVTACSGCRISNIHHFWPPLHSWRRAS